MQVFAKAGLTVFLLLSPSLVQAQYWQDPFNEPEYRKYSKFLAILNQENVSSITSVHTCIGGRGRGQSVYLSAHITGIPLHVKHPKLVAFVNTSHGRF